MQSYSKANNSGNKRHTTINRRDTVSNDKRNSITANPQGKSAKLELMNQKRITTNKINIGQQIIKEPKQERDAWFLTDEMFPELGGKLKQLQELFNKAYNKQRNSENVYDGRKCSLDQVYKKVSSQCHEYYAGELLDGKRNKKGKYMKLQVKNHQIVEYVNYYYGQYFSDDKHAWGYYIDDDSVYEGQFKENKKHGKGQYISIYGYKYDGQWKHDRMDGKGEYTDNNRYTYVGYYENGLKNGYGKYTAEDRYTYIGEWVDDKKQGDGKYVDKYGQQYEGEFYNDMKHGQGTFVDKYKQVYEGEWSNDMRDGYGEQTYRDKSKYFGDWFNDKRHGNGEHIYNDGAKYVGQYKDDKRHGDGEYVDKYGQKYEGEYQNGMKHGSGEQTNNDGSKYVGQYSEDNKDGYGYYNDSKGNKYIGYFAEDKKQGQGQIMYSNGSKFKGGFYKDYKQGKGSLVDKNGNVKRGFWFYDQFQEEIQKVDNESCLKQIRIQILRVIGNNLRQFTMSLFRNQYIQMAFELEQFADYNDYEELILLDDNGSAHKWFYKMYYIFGKIIRPLFIDFIGPFIPFIGYFQIIIDKADSKECGGVRSGYISMINYLFLFSFVIGQIMVIIFMILRHRSQFRQQADYFYQNANLKAELVRNDYKKKYGEINFDFNFQNVDVKQIEDQNKNTNRIHSEYDTNRVETEYGTNRLDTFSSQDQTYMNNIFKQPQTIRPQYSKENDSICKKSILKRQQTHSSLIFSKLNRINEQHQKYKFDYFRSYNDLIKIGSTFVLDIDLLSDSMAVQSCYALSLSQNLPSEIRNDLSFYYKCSLVVLFISLLPKFNCYLFLLFRLVTIKLGILERQQNKTQERLVKQNSLFKKLIFYLYMIISRFYGVKYNPSKQYTFKSKNAKNDIKRLFYVNHEDMFTAEQYNPAKQTVDLLNYDEMEKKTHSQLRINLFRVFFENIPQLVLQAMMLHSLQQSQINKCRQTDFAFYQSIALTGLNMAISSIEIMIVVFQKLLGGDLVIQDMKLLFDKYLKKNKTKNMDNRFVINNHIEFYPKMIKSLYEFALQNNKYDTIEFGDKVLFKFNKEIDEYFELIEFAEQQDPLTQPVKICFSNDDKSEQQIMTELTIKKIFEELMIMTSNIEYYNQNNQKRFIVKYQKGYKLGRNIESWVGLLEKGSVEIDINIQYSWKYVLQRLSREQIKRMGQSLKIIINHIRFDIDLLSHLLEMKEIIECAHLVIRDERVKQIVENGKSTIARIEGGISKDQCEEYFQYEEYFKMKEQLDGLKVEIKSIEYGIGFYDYYSQQEKEDQQVIKDIYSFQYAVIDINEGFQLNLQKNMEMVRELGNIGVGQLKSDLLKLDQYCDAETLQAVEQMREINPSFRLIYDIDDSRKSRWKLSNYQSLQNKIRVKEFMKMEQVDINEIKFNISADLWYFDQAFEKYVDSDECQDIFGKLDKVTICLEGQDLQNIVKIKKRQKRRKSKYEIKTVRIYLDIQQPSIDGMMSLFAALHSYYEKIETIELDVQNLGN